MEIDIIKMLLMYLKEHKIRAHVPEQKSMYSGGYDDKVKIIVHLKHADIDDTIEISIAQLEISVEGTKVLGNPMARASKWDKPKPQEIADLTDPQSFERIRMWIRQQEKAMRYSIEVTQAASRLRASAYTDPGDLKFEDCEETIEDYETLMGKEQGDKLRKMIEDTGL